MAINRIISEVTNSAFDSIIGQAETLKTLVLSTVSTPAITSTVSFLSSATSLSSLAKSFIPEGFSIPNISLQSQLRSLSGLTDATQRANLLASIEEELTARGFSVPTLVTDAASVVAAGKSLNGTIENIVKDPTGKVFELATGVKLSSFDPVEEFEAVFNNNLSFASAKAAASSAITDAVGDASEILPTVSKGVLKVGTKSREVAQSFNGLSIKKSITNPFDAYEDGERKTVSSAGFSNRVSRIPETFVVASTEFPVTLKYTPAKIITVIGKTSEAVVSSDGSKTTKFNLVPTDQLNRKEYFQQDKWKYNESDNTFNIEEIYRKYESVVIIYAYNENYDPTYAKITTV